MSASEKDDQGERSAIYAERCPPDMPDLKKQEIGVMFRAGRDQFRGPVGLERGARVAEIGRREDVKRL